MGTTIIKHINEALTNDVLAKDVYSNGRLIISKNTPLTKRLITLLKSRQIREIQTKNTEFAELTEFEKYKEVAEAVNEKRKIEVDNFFQECLAGIGSETKYGNMLSSSEDIEFIMNLFKDIHDNYDFIDELYKLKEWDHYTFIHSFDVFVLGSLFAKKKGVLDLESVGLGYLLHDIGKLNIPQDLLQLERKLNFKEFSLMKTHTTEGYSILTKLGLNRIAQYAKSHHERIDGSGYPEQLTGNDLSTELQILQIVDVYSALTLNRPYREALSAAKALDVLFRNAHQYNQELLRDFIELLKIYPSNATVLLSDSTFAKVEKVNESFPMLPVVKRVNDFADFKLPHDFKITIKRMIEYKPKYFQDRFKEFTRNLIAGNEDSMLEEFSDLIDGLKIEEIYSQVIIPLTRMLTILYEGNIDDCKKFNLRISSIKKLLLFIEDHILVNNRYTSQSLLVVEGNQNSSIHVKILEGLLHVENIYPIVIKNPGSQKMIQEIVRDFNIQSIFLFNATGIVNQKVPLHLPNITYRSIAHQELVKLIDSIPIASKQSLQVFKWLEARP